MKQTLPRWPASARYLIWQAKTAVCWTRSRKNLKRSRPKMLHDSRYQYLQVVEQGLLDGYDLIQVMAISQAGNPEPAAAQDPHQFIFFDAVAWEQGMEVVSHG